MGGLLLFSVQTLPPVSLLNSGWPHRAKRLASPELNPPVNSDSDPEPMPKEDPEETSAQVGGVLPFPLRLPSPSSSGPLPISTKWEVVSLCVQLLAALFLCRNPCPYSPLRTQGFNFSTLYFFFQFGCAVQLVES